jgi:glycerophosphoryl diester phosphodiesterase
MVAAAEAANLTVLTYGRENNEPENVRKQAELGVRGAILDEVSLGARACSCVLHWCY